MLSKSCLSIRCFSIVVLQPRVAIVLCTCVLQLHMLFCDCGYVMLFFNCCSHLSFLHMSFCNNALCNCCFSIAVSHSCLQLSFCNCCFALVMLQVFRNCVWQLLFCSCYFLDPRSTNSCTRPISPTVVNVQDVTTDVKAKKP